MSAPQVKLGKPRLARITVMTTWRYCKAQERKQVCYPVTRCGSTAWDSPTPQDSLIHSGNPTSRFLWFRQRSPEGIMSGNQSKTSGQSQACMQDQEGPTHQIRHRVKRTDYLLINLGTQNQITAGSQRLEGYGTSGESSDSSLSPRNPFVSSPQGCISSTPQDLHTTILERYRKRLERKIRMLAILKSFIKIMDEDCI